VNEGAPIANTHVPPQALNNVLRNDIGCTPQTLHNWVAQAERDRGLRGGVTTDERAQMNAMEREIKELREDNEILRKASTYFAQAEFDRRPNSCRKKPGQRLPGRAGASTSPWPPPIARRLPARRATGRARTSHRPWSCPQS
jgi:transposase